LEAAVHTTRDECLMFNMQPFTFTLWPCKSKIAYIFIASCFIQSIDIMILFAEASDYILGTLWLKLKHGQCLYVISLPMSLFTNEP
jgi:hypothetical protein